MVRAEMEHRCDDMAVKMTGSKKNYAYALISMQYADAYNVSNLAMGLAKNKGKLTTRIERIISTKNIKTMNFNKHIAALLVLLVSATLLAFNLPNAHTKSQPSSAIENSVLGTPQVYDVIAEADTIPLYIVDGTEISKTDVEKLDANNINSLTVLIGKNAEQYGEKGKNGVILIETKANHNESLGSLGKVVVTGYATSPNVIPLYVVDGKEMSKDDCEKIDSNNINSVTVLKDKSATETYGEKGKNGVILIETKAFDAESNVGTKSTADSLGTLAIRNYKNHITISASQNASQRSRMTGDFKMSFDATDNRKIIVTNNELTEPMILVDGVKVEAISDLDPKNIESVTVLKGSIALKEYGSDATNGVIVVTTKEKESVDTIKVVEVVEKKMKISYDHQLATRQGPESYLSGVITDVDGIGLPGTNVFIKGTTIGTVSDLNGQFKIRIPEDAKAIVFSFIGYPIVEESLENHLKNSENSVNQVSALDQNFNIYPNPAAQLVDIDFSLKEDSDSQVLVDIMSLDTKEVVKSLNNKMLAKGEHKFQWDASKEKAGIYVITIQTAGQRLSRRVVVSH